MQIIRCKKCHRTFSLYEPVYSGDGSEDRPVRHGVYSEDGYLLACPVCTTSHLTLRDTRQLELPVETNNPNTEEPDYDQV